jgi:uncharacterized protein
MSFALSPEVGVLLLGTFVAALVTGISGFAFGLVAAAIWLQTLPPSEVTALIVAYALLIQGYAVWKLRKTIVPDRLWPFLIGSAAGIPGGVAILHWLSSAQMKVAVAGLLVLFSVYNLVRPKMPSVAWAGRPGDSVVGVLNGALGAATGLAGILVVIWSSARGWSANEQRAVFQPAAVATFAMCLPVVGGAGLMSSRVITLFLVGLPALVVGTMAGWALYGRLDEATFRKIVLWLLLASGLAMLVTVR